VFPYGDSGDDWLELDKVRAGRTRRLVTLTKELQDLEDVIRGRPHLLTPGNNQVFGAVAISRLKHPKIGINISRERLVENETFHQLRRFVQLGIYWMTIQYARITESERREQAKAKEPSIPTIIEETQNKVRIAAEIPPEYKREILTLLDYAKERAQAVEEEHISELSMLRIMSSAGAMVSMMNHQLRAVVDGIRAIHTDLSEIKPYVSFDLQQKYDEILKQIQAWREMVTRQVSQLGFLLGPDARLRRRRLPLRKIVDNVTRPLSLYMRDFSIGFTNNVPQNLKTPPIYEAELHAILLQAYTNALKAVRDKDIRQIAVNAHREADGLHIFMVDTGIGLDVGQHEEVFKPFVTTSDPDPILGIGTGLGLWIMRDLLETYGGTARFIDADKPWNTCIEIILPDER
jgi:signal transduction histidine kinase